MSFLVVTLGPSSISSTDQAKLAVFRDVSVDDIEASGAAPIVINPVELFAALVTGILDGVAVEPDDLDELLPFLGEDAVVYEVQGDALILANLMTPTSGNDDLQGTDGKDKVSLLEGDDIFVAKAGNDRIKGNDGNDSIKGGEGKDKLKGGDGKDTLEGGKGADTLEGGKGNDLINGGNKGDVLIAGKGSDTVTGGKGADEFHFVAQSGKTDYAMDVNQDDGDTVFVTGDYQTRDWDSQAGTYTFFFADDYKLVFENVFDSTTARYIDRSAITIDQGTSSTLQEADPLLLG